MKTQTVKVLAVILLLGLLPVSVALGVIMWRIHQSVEACCAVAQKYHPHPGDDITSLIELVDSDARSFRDRNLAIWTLGRLRDPKALPSMKALYSADPCDHDRNLCQYELEKAIKLCGGIPGPPRKTKH